KKADGLVNLYCLAHVRRHFVRAGDANPTQLRYWSAAWLERIKALYAAHEQLMAAWTAAAVPAPGQAAAAATRLAQAYDAWDDALATIDTERRKQMAAPGTTVAVFRCVAVVPLRVMCCSAGLATLRHLLSVTAGYPVSVAARSRVL